MTGFGASSAWNTLTPSDHELLWDVDKGAGLSLLRIRIDETGTTTSTSNVNQLEYARIAAAKGVTVWAAPWSPVAAWQTPFGNNERKMNFAYAQQWADRLATFARETRAMGIPLYAISAQNEPDGTNFNHFEPAELVDWIKTYLGPAMASTGVKIIAPETVNWCGFGAYEAAILADAKASSYVPIVATHEYGCTPKAYPDIQAAGKEFWETEIYESISSPDQGIDSGLNTAKIIHEALTIANVNAWHYWWIHGGAGTGLFPDTSSTPSKRLWVMGNYSRFVRPGFVRVGAPAAPTAGVTLTAFYGAANGRLVIVAINANGSATSQPFTISGMTPAKVTPWVTDASHDLEAQPPVSLAGSGFTYSLPARSVTSLVIDSAGPAVFRPCPTDGTPCKIMPLGDSITAGSNIAGAYRMELFRLAGADRKAITFVGSGSNGPATVDGQPFPPRHEGHPGYTIDDIHGARGIYPLVQGALTTSRPHVVLLMIGTNDVNGSLDLANAPTRLGLLLDRITTTSPDALVVVAQIIPFANDGRNPTVQAYNAGVADAVARRSAAGKHVVLVDMYGAFTANPRYRSEWMADGLHPTADGYAAMARAWYPAIRSVLPVAP